MRLAYGRRIDDRVEGGLAMTRKVGIAASVALTVASAGLVAAAPGGGASEGSRSAEPKKKPLRFEQHDLFIEFNATDRDAGVQMNLDGEDWTRLLLRDPGGNSLLEVTPRRELRDNGLTELFFESAEPPLSEVPFSRFKKRFPEGKYSFRGRTVEGRKMVGSDRFSHQVPDGPKITSPRDGEQVDPDGFTITWERVTRPAGIDIASYIVVVTQGEREMTIPLPASATSVAVPGQFLTAGPEGEVEVLAREKSGNQTITSREFRTR
jgi:hypothetical protein